MLFPKSQPLVLLLLFLLVSCRQNQPTATQNNNDSIKKYIDLAANESLSNDKRVVYNDRAYSFTLKQENSVVNRENISKIISNCYNLNDWNGYDESSSELLKNSKTSKDSFYLAKAYRYRGNYFYNFSVLDSSFYYYLKSEKLYTDLNDLDGIASIFLKKGAIQYNYNNYSEADILFLKAYNIFKNNGNKEKLIYTLNYLGLVSTESKEYKKAIKYFEKGLKLINDNQNDKMEL